MIESWPTKSVQRPFFRAAQGRNALASDEGGRATVRNARLARCCQTVSYELGTSSELALYARLSGRVHLIKHFFRKNLAGLIIPTLMHRILPELRS